MDIFAKVLQGPYAYLLILQVLIVSGLLLTLIYLIVLRLRETPVAVIEEKAPDIAKPATLFAAPVVVAAPGPPAPIVAAPAPAEPSLVAESADVSEPAQPLIPTLPTPPVAPVAPSGFESRSEIHVDMSIVEAEKERANALESEANAMRDKVRYLESKLLEYEILQEEIGALSSLKLENERLRQELIQNRSRGGAPAPTPPTPPTESAAAAPASAPIPETAAAAPASNPAPEVAASAPAPLAEGAKTPAPEAVPLPPEPSTLSAQGAAAAAADLLGTPSTAPAAPPAPNEIPDATDDNTRSTLDGLLRQLDTLTDKSSSGKNP